jgi:hypothetical protein
VTIHLPVPKFEIPRSTAATAMGLVIDSAYSCLHWSSWFWSRCWELSLFRAREGLAKQRDERSARTISNRSVWHCTTTTMIYGSFPPAYTVDSNGRMLHSWRTLLLPYLEQEHLYRQIDLSKPWYDPANAAAFEATVDVFQCRSTEMPKESYDLPGSQRSGLLLSSTNTASNDLPTSKMARQTRLIVR